MHLSRTLTYFAITIIMSLPGYSAGQIINGDFNTALTGWDTRGDVTADQGAAILRTGGIYGMYDTSLYTTFVVSGNSLNFKYYFDITGPDDILSPDFPSYPFDSFQVSLDDGTGNYKVEALAWEPFNDFVSYSLDISNFSYGTIVTLSFDLIDQDDGFTSIAAIDDVIDHRTPVPEPGSLILLGSGLIWVFLSGRNRSNLIYRLLIILSAIMIPGIGTAHGALIEQNIDDLTRLDFTSPVFNTRTSTLSLDMVVTNISDTAIHIPLKVIITGISTTDVTVANPDGYTVKGLPYFDLSGGITDHELSPGERTSTVKLMFHNPKKIKFRWDQDVEAFVDVYEDSGPVLENICLVPGELPPVCEFYKYDLEIKNPEFDNLIQRQLPDMFRYEQVRVYAYDYEDIPVHVVINNKDAVYHENGFYYYSDVVLQDGLNTISIELINESGMTITRGIIMYIDSIPPNVEIIQPAAGSVVTSRELIIEGSVDDPAVDYISLIENYIISRNVPVSEGKFVTNISLQPGHNNITIESADLAGNSISNNLDIIYAYSETSKVSGRIINESINRPVAGAVVTLSRQNGDFISVISDEGGIYRIDGVRSGDVTISVEKYGYESKNITICALGGDSPHEQDIVLHPAVHPGSFTLTGQIIDTSGQPLKGVTVSISGSSLHTTSDNNGIYVISGIPRISFEAGGSLTGYVDAIVSVNVSVFSKDTLVLIHNFILSGINYSIGISYPEGGGYADGNDTIVKGFIKSGDIDAGVRVNGVLANVYNGYFVANGIPLSEGMNRITAEMINANGIIAADSIELIRPHTVNEGILILAQEAGIVPLGLKVIIEGPPGIIFSESNIHVTGPAVTQVLSDDISHYTILINEPGIYSLSFTGKDSSGNHYNGRFEFTGMVKNDVEVMLKKKWHKFKEHLFNNNIEDALSMIAHETRSRYLEQFHLAGSRLSDFFGNLGDIQLVALSDNVAKARVYQDDATYYIWFSRDIYGLWKIYKF